MTAVAKAGDKGIDFSGFRLDTPGKIADAKKAKGTFVLRYSAGQGNSSAGTQWKLCGLHEIATLVADGFDPIANSEWYESRVTEGGAAGKADGLADLSFWKSRGYAKGGHIIVSWDQSPSPSAYANVESYLRNYAASLGGYYRVGLYAGSMAIREMKRRGVASCGWQMMSTSFSDNHLEFQPNAGQILARIKSPPAGIDIWQTGNYWFGNQADENVMFTNNVISHLKAKGGVPAPPPVKPPAPKPTPKPVPVTPGGSYIVRPSDADGLIAVCKRHHVTDWQSVAKLNHILGPSYIIHVGDVIRWPGGTNTKPAAPVKAKRKVVSGDTMSSIANAWGVSLQSLEKANPKAGHPAGNFDVIYAGDIITHP